MNKKSILISSNRLIGWHPVIDNTRSCIEIPCPSCTRKMNVFQRSRLDKKRIFACICGYRNRVNEEDYEALTGLCFTCNKVGCCANNHRFIGVIPAGRGL